jgi:hypothetical protein
MATTPFTLEIREGRLLEGRIRSPIAPPDVRAFMERLRFLLGGLGGRKVVIATELLQADVLPPEVAAAFLTVMKTDNPLVERSAFLVGDSAMFGLQVEKLIREAGHPARRTFRDAAALESWLGEVLSPPEKTRLKTFLGR